MDATPAELLLMQREAELKQMEEIEEMKKQIIRDRIAQGNVGEEKIDEIAMQLMLRLQKKMKENDLT